MQEETQAAPVATAEIPATELTNTTEVVTEETSVETADPPPEQERDKAIKSLQRQLNRKHAKAAEAAAERDFYRQRLEQYEAQHKEPEEPQERSPQVSEREINRRAEQLAAARAFDRQCNEVAAKGAKKFSDFQDAINTLATEMPLFGKDNAPTPAMEALMEANDPPALMRHLGKNPDLASELADLSPTRLARRLERIEREMATPKTSNAPKPLEPVKASASESGLSSAKSDKEWADMRDKELKAQGKRL